MPFTTVSTPQVFSLLCVLHAMFSLKSTTGAVSLLSLTTFSVNPSSPDNKKDKPKSAKAKSISNSSLSETSEGTDSSNSCHYGYLFQFLLLLHTVPHISLLLCLVWMWLALNQESVNKHWRSALHVMRLTDWLACFSRLWGVEEAGRQDSDEGKQLLSPGENIWESSDQSSSCTACPRPRGLDIQIWWK